MQIFRLLSKRTCFAGYSRHYLVSTTPQCKWHLKMEARDLPKVLKNVLRKAFFRNLNLFAKRFSSVVSILEVSRDPYASSQKIALKKALIYQRHELL